MEVAAVSQRRYYRLQKAFSEALDRGLQPLCGPQVRAEEVGVLLQTRSSDRQRISTSLTHCSLPRTCRRCFPAWQMCTLRHCTSCTLRRVGSPTAGRVMGGKHEFPREGSTRQHAELKLGRQIASAAPLPDKFASCQRPPATQVLKNVYANSKVRARDRGVVGFNSVGTFVLCEFLNAGHTRKHASADACSRQSTPCFPSSPTRADTHVHRHARTHPNAGRL